MTNGHNMRYSEILRFVMWVSQQPDATFCLSTEQPRRGDDGRWKAADMIPLPPAKLAFLDALPTVEIPMPLTMQTYAPDNNPQRCRDNRRDTAKTDATTANKCDAASHGNNDAEDIGKRPEMIFQNKEMKEETKKEERKEKVAQREKEKEEIKKKENAEKNSFFSSQREKTSRARGRPSPTNEKKLEALRQRQHAFWQQLLTFEHKYGREYITQFFAYWSERGASTYAMRCERCKTWDTDKRLARWHPDPGGEMQRAIAADLRQRNRARAEAEAEARERNQQAWHEQKQQENAARDEACRTAVRLEDARRDPRYWQALGKPMPEEFKQQDENG